MAFMNRILSKTNLRRNNCFCQSKVTSQGNNVFLEYSSSPVHKFLQFTVLEIDSPGVFNL